MKKYFTLFVVVLAGFIQAQWLPVNVRFSGTAPESNTYIYGDNKMAVLLIGTNYLYKSFDNGVVWMVDWFDPAEKQTKIGGTEGGHLLSVGQDLVKYYFSTNRGGSWKIVKTGLQNTGAIVDVKGSRNNLFFIALPQKLYRKSPINDSILNLTLPLTGNETIRNLAAFKTSGEILFTTSTGRVFRSSNDGTDWNEMANFNTIFSTFETYGNSNIVLVGIKGSQTTLYSSTNKGITWDSLSMPFSCVEIHMTTPARGFAKAFTNELYYTVDSMKTWTKHQSLKMLRGCTTSGEKGIMIPPSFEVNSTSNSGENWQQISELNTNLAKAIEILADNSAYALTASGELYRSGNYGSTWNLIKDSLPSNLTKTIRETDTSFLAYSPGGTIIRYSNSSGNITDLTHLYPDFNTAIYTYNRVLYVATEYQNIKYSTDFGLTWTIKPIPSTAGVHYIFAKDSMMYIGSDGNYYFESFDHGNTWLRDDMGHMVTNNRVHFIYRHYNRMFACTSGDGSYYSNYGGGWSWFWIPSLQTKNAFYLNQNFWIFQTTSSEIFQTTDEGYTIKKTLHYPDVINIASVKFNPPNFGLMLDVNGALYKMHNGGVPVEMTSFNAEVVPNGVLLRWETATETNNYGFFVQRKNNGVWSDLAFIPGMGTTLNPSEYSFLDELKPDKGDTNYYRLKQVDLSGEFSYSKEIAIGFTPYTLELDQNYPNPFSTGTDNGNSETVIRFRLPEDGETKLTVYDTQGRVVEELLNGSLPAGEHSFAFPSKVSSPASGVYFYELKFNGKIKRGKMLLLR